MRFWIHLVRIIMAKEKALIYAGVDDPPGITIAQHSSRFVLAESDGVLKSGRVLKQGENSLRFFAGSQQVWPGTEVE